ncbi:restriction endonuclease subunit S [Nonomuraea longispora]|uniref:Restriction endonuclease subunit S n=1 Tax=Nonomuraea longispora TaxID=1848320 RepID=A0A4R4N8J1_9ACTN|nr:restriction endonuclease subunit S [Nonomuraea longispora]TDC03247.1 restriction endonuclease subunit S [Nonomuraea longispora]
MRNLPDGWRRVGLAEITKEQTEKVGGRKSVTVLSSTKHRGLVPSDEYFKGRTIYSSDLAGYKAVRRGWFAYATNHLAEGSIGLQEAFDIACISPIYTVFSCVEGVYPPYLFRVLKSPDLLAAYRVHEQASVDRRGAVRYRDFGKIPIHIPPEHEQRRIVEVLDALDMQISTIDLVLDKLGFRHHGLSEAQMKSAEAKMMPLSAHLARPPKNGYSPKEVDEWTGLVALGLGCLTTQGFQPRQLKNVPVLDGRNASAMVNDGDLLMSRANTRELVGLAGVYRDVGMPCIYPDLMMKLIPLPTCRTEYLELHLRSDDIRRRIQAIAQGTSESMGKISGSEVQRLLVAIPSLAEQDRILKVVNTSQEGIELRKRERDKLALLKQGLAEDLLTGRMRVETAEAVLEGL